MTSVIFRIENGKETKTVGQFLITEIPKIGEKVIFPDKKKYGRDGYEVLEVNHNLPDMSIGETDSVIEVIVFQDDREEF